MINLTQFIGNKVKTNNTLHTNKLPDTKDKAPKPFNYSKPLNEKQQFQNISQRSIGLSTLLDLQNQQQAFGEFNISRIEARTSHLKYTKRQSNLSNTVSLKSDMKQMRQRRKALEQKVNRTLRKQQYRNKAFNIDQSRHQSLKETSRLPQQMSNISQNQSSSAKPSILVQQSEYSSKSLSQPQDYSSINSTNNKNSQPQPSQYSYSQYASMRKSNQSVNKQSDLFIKYLHKDMYLLKCDKFIKFIQNFKYRFILKNLKQYVEIQDIINREQLKLCRFVFISWKRQTKECLQKLAMIQMIKKRLQQKRVQQKRVQQKRVNQLTKEHISKDYNIGQQESVKQVQSAQRSKVKAMIPQKQQALLSRQTMQQKIALKHKDQSQLYSKQISNEILQSQVQNCLSKNSYQYVEVKPSQIKEQGSMNEMHQYYYSQLNIQQVSPIKVRPQKDQQQNYQQNQCSFYSKYSCYTDKDMIEEDQEYIK